MIAVRSDASRSGPILPGRCGPPPPTSWVIRSSWHGLRSGASRRFADATALYGDGRARRYRAPPHGFRPKGDDQLALGQLRLRPWSGAAVAHCRAAALCRQGAASPAFPACTPSCGRATRPGFGADDNCRLPSKSGSTSLFRPRRRGAAFQFGGAPPWSSRVFNGSARRIGANERPSLSRRYSSNSATTSQSNGGEHAFKFIGRSGSFGTLTIQTMTAGSRNASPRPPRPGDRRVSAEWTIAPTRPRSREGIELSGRRA